MPAMRAASCPAATRPVLVAATIALIFTAPTVVGAEAEQVHVTLGADEGTLVVQWAVPERYAEADPPEVRWSAAGGERPSAAALLAAEVEPAPGNTSRSTYVYAARLTAVAPGEHVTYQPGSPAEGFAGPFDVRMPPAADERARFVAYADISLDDVAPDGGPKSSDAVSHRLRDQATSQNPDLAIIPGDLAYTHTRSGWDAFMRFMQPLQSSTPTMPTPGNHEYHAELGYARLLDHYVLPGNEQDFVFRAGPVTFVAVNSDAVCGPGQGPSETSADPVCDDGDVDPHQGAWVRQAFEDAAADPTRWTIVYFHHPLYSWGHHGGHDGLRALWAPWFEDHGVDLVINGHDHLYSRSYPVAAGRVMAVGNAYAEDDGVVYVVTGGGGRELHRLPAGDPPAWHAAGESVHHLVRIDATPERLDVVALRADGSQMDSFAILTAGAEQAERPSPVHAAGPLVAAVAFVAAAVALRRLRGA